MPDHYGDLVRSKTEAKQLATGMNARGDVLCLNDRIVLAAAPAADRVFVGRVHSSNVLLRSSKIYHAALGSGVTLDFGDKNEPDALVDGHVCTNAGDVDALDEIGLDALGDPLWKVLNYAEDPQDYLDLFLTTGVGAATGAVAWELYFAQ